MKKLFAILTTIMMVIVMSSSAFAAGNNYYGYGYGYGYGYQYDCDQYVYSGMRYSYDSVTAKNPVNSSATRLEIVKHYQALLDDQYNSYNNYGGYTNNGYNGYNNGYGYNNLQQFADYNNLVNGYNQQELDIMSRAFSSGLLRGIEENGYIFAAPERYVTRAQYAAFTNRAMQISGIYTYGNYQLYNFRDVAWNHWALADIHAVVQKGIMNGYSSDTFGPEGSIKGEDALITYYRLFVEESYKYDAERFATVVNGVGYYWLNVNSSTSGSYFRLNDLGTMNVGDQYTVRVSTDIPNFNNNKAYWTSSNPYIASVDNYGRVTALSSGNTVITATCNGMNDSITVYVNGNGNGYDGRTATWYFTRKNVPINLGDTFDLSSIMSRWPSNVTFSVSGNGISVSRNGIVTPNAVGVYTVTGSAEGCTDTVTITVSNPGSSYPVETQAPTELKFDQSRITVQKGNSINLYDHLVNKMNASFTSDNPSYVSVSGNTAYANAVTSSDVKIIATSGSQTAYVYVRVVDNNAKEENLNSSIKVSYAQFNTSGACNVTVTGIPAGYTVKVNNDDYMSSYVNTKAATDGMVQLQVTGLYPTAGVDADGQINGGVDSLIICVYNAQGVQVWEDPNGQYCPQYNCYMSQLNW